MGYQEEKRRKRNGNGAKSAPPGGGVSGPPRGLRGTWHTGSMNSDDTAGSDQEQNQPVPRGRGPGRPFQPGQSGNPAGRPPGGLSVQAALIRALERPWVVPDGEEQGVTRTKLDQLARAMVDAAIGGSVPAAEWVGNRLEGRVASKVEISGQTEKTVVVVPWRPATRAAIQAAEAQGALTSRGRVVDSDLVPDVEGLVVQGEQVTEESET